MNVPSFWWLLIVVATIIESLDANWITGNLCWSMPCLNGGSCFGSAYTYLCVCPINYSGALCEKRLGICQESPCGNRGLCIETGLTSFECRCYFDYMGPTCEEHVPKNDPALWSSLIPVHTRVLFDMLQEAYRSKARGKVSIASGNGQIDFVSLLTTDASPLSSPSSITEMPILTTSTSHLSETTEHVIPADEIQLEKIFPEISTVSSFDTKTISFTEQSPSFVVDTTFQMLSNTGDSSSSATRVRVDTTIVENQLTTETIGTVSSNSTEEQESVAETTEQSITASTKKLSTKPNGEKNTTQFFSTIIRKLSTTTPIVQTTENFIDEINSTIESQQFAYQTTVNLTSFESETTTIEPINSTEDVESTSSPPIITSTVLTFELPSSSSESTVSTTTLSQNAHNQLLYKLCQQLLAHILPNTSSSSSSAIAEVLSLRTGSSSIDNKTADALLFWLNRQLSTTTTSTTTTTSSPTILPTLLINESKSSTLSLQRLDMDDVLHRMNSNDDADQ